MTLYDTATASVEGAQGALTFTSGNTEVVTVDAESGELTPVAPGSAQITVDAAETDEFNAASTTFSVTVIKLDLKNATFKGTIPSGGFVYDGTPKIPQIELTYKGTTLVEGTDFYVSWRDNKKIGKATLIIAGMDNFEGAKQTTFKIIPQSVKLSSLKAGKKSLTVKWKKGSKIDGYEIQYSLKSNFKSAKKITITGASTKKVEIEGLKKKKTYYVRIRTFKKVGSKKYYSEWSEVKSKKTK
jgi:uncharacterized protein YjdB